MPDSTPSTDLPRLRAEIDALDERMLELINERARLALKIGELKAASQAAVFSASREAEVLARLVAANPGPLGAETVRAVWRELISGARALQKPLKIAYLGPEYTYSHLAALERFGQAAELVGVASIAAVFDEVRRGHADYGVVPLENTSEGRIADTLERFARHADLKITAEVRLRIHHHLLSNRPAHAIQRIYSKAQAFGQCRDWLAQNMPLAQLIDVGSTAKAAERAAAETDAAAVASRQAATRYGLRTLFEAIEDYPENETRFAVIGTHAAQPTGKDKTALLLQVSDQPGSLLEALALFKRHGVNLTMIESFPSRSVPASYLFFVDAEGHAHEAQLAGCLEELHKVCARLDWLGSYPASEVIE